MKKEETEIESAVRLVSTLCLFLTQTPPGTYSPFRDISMIERSDGVCELPREKKDEKGHRQRRGLCHVSRVIEAKGRKVCRL